MKCYYHEDREAVATCQHCGKFLCKSCAQVHTPCFCDECFALLSQEAQHQQQEAAHQRRAQSIAALADTRQEFFKTCLLGIAVAAVLTLLYANGGGPHTLSEMLFVGCYCFFIPFGWKLLTYLQSFLPVTIFGTLWFWLFWICVKGMVSIFVGIPAFIYQAVRTLRNQKRIQQLQNECTGEVV